MARKAPDIVVIVLDDVGFADLGCFGAEVRTPHLDRLASEGLRFTRFDTRAICAPSRAALLSGRNSHSVGMADLPARTPAEADAADPSFRGELPVDLPLLSHHLREGGYRTVALGKWHLAPQYEEDPDRPHRSWPRDRGFDRFYGFIGGHTDQYRPALIDDDTPVAPPSDEDYHLTADLVDHAIAELPSVADPDAASDRPSFVYLATGAAHSPHQVPAAYRDRYRGTYDVGWDEIRARRFRRQLVLGVIPEHADLPPRNDGDRAWDDLTVVQRRVFARFQENYAGFIEHTDEHLGRLLEHVRMRDRDTIVFVLSDNGPAPEGDQHGNFRALYRGEDTPVDEIAAHLDEMGGPATAPMYPRPWAMVSATPFRRYKLWPYAGGVRAPLIAWWPGRIADPGAIRPQFLEMVDLAPTILQAAGFSDADIPPRGMHGRSALPTFADTEAPTRTTQYFELRSNRAITDGDWRAIAMHVPGTPFAHDRWALFHIADDPAEAHNVSAQHPDVLERMIALWHAEARSHLEPPEHEVPELLRTLGYFDDGYPPRAEHQRPNRPR